MRWPEKPTCHGDVTRGGVFRFDPPTWRPQELNRVDTCECGYRRVDTYGIPFQSCSHCGSMHPSDLVSFMQTPNVRLSGSDWKYLYPHKFYVEGITNPLRGQLVDSTSLSASFDHEPSADELKAVIDNESARYKPEYFHNPVLSLLPAQEHQIGRFWPYHLHWQSQAPATTHAKFYTAHLEDEGYDAEAHDLLLNLVSTHSGITFTRKEDSTPEQPYVHYVAPYFGYQRA